jgi:hypothetical protein
MANNGEEENENWSKLPVEHPRKLIPELCRLFYQLGWVTGSKKIYYIKVNLFNSSRHWWWYILKIQRFDLFSSEWCTKRTYST